MTASRVRLVLLAWVVALLVITSASWAAMTDPRSATDWEEVVLILGLGFGFTTVGAVLVVRRPREPMGRMALLIGLTAIVATGLRSISIVLDGPPGPIPAVGALAAVISSQLLHAVLPAGGLLLVRFPAGREPDRLSALADALFFVALGCIAVVTFAPGEIQSSGILPVRNPIGIEALGRETAEAMANLGLFSYVAGLAVTAALLTRRYRRSGPVVRAQIRWVAAAGALPVILFPGLFLGPEWLWSLWFLSLALLPLAIGIAILRYRLYEIDRIVSRTISYALGTALLAIAFLATNLALQTVLADATGGATLTTAVSTLVVAGLFQPIRRRVQAPIDRRFNRARVDGERIVETFAGLLRDQVDLDRLRSAAVATVDDAVAPAVTSMWLRGTR